MKDETALWMMVVLVLGVICILVVGRGCHLDAARMNHVVQCLEQGQEAEECEVIK